MSGFHYFNNLTTFMCFAVQGITCSPALLQSVFPRRIHRSSRHQKSTTYHRREMATPHPHHNPGSLGQRPKIATRYEARGHYDSRRFEWHDDRRARSAPNPTHGRPVHAQHGIQRRLMDGCILMYLRPRSRCLGLPCIPDGSQPATSNFCWFNCKQTKPYTTAQNVLSHITTEPPRGSF